MLARLPRLPAGAYGQNARAVAALVVPFAYRTTGKRSRKTGTQVLVFTQIVAGKCHAHSDTLPWRSTSPALRDYFSLELFKAGVIPILFYFIT